MVVNKRKHIVQSDDEIQQLSPSPRKKENKENEEKENNNVRVTRSTAAKNNLSKEPKINLKSLYTDEDSSVDDDYKFAKEKSSASIRKRPSNNRNVDVCRISDDDDDKMTDKPRKKLRKLIADDKLDKETLNAIHAEKERLKRIEKQQEIEKGLQMQVNSDADNGVIPLEEAKSEETTQHNKGVAPLYLAFDRETNKPIIQIDKEISKHLKDHQIEAVKFMWTSCFESLEQIRLNVEGSGCVLAVC